MTLYNLIQPSELGSDRYQRDAKIIDVFGLKELDLSSIRSDERVIDRVFKGAKTLIERLKEKNIDPAIIPAQLTIGNLALLIDDGSYSLSPPMRLVGTAIQKKYREERESVKKETSLEPTYTQLLREELGIYQGNLYEAKKAWPGIEVSPSDWLKDIRIPANIGLEEAILLGIYYAHGTIISQSDRKNDSKIEMIGKSHYSEFYEHIVKPLLKKVHNIVPNIPSDERLQKAAEKNKWGFSYNGPYFEISSLALVSWLQKSFDMPNSRKEDRKIPEFSNLEQKLGFFKGVVGVDGDLYIYPDRSRMRISGESLYIQGLEKLSSDLGFSPAKSKDGKVLDYSKEDIINMIRMGVFINPRHIESTYKIGMSVIGSLRKEGKLSLEDLKTLIFLYNCNVSTKAILEYSSLSPTTNISYYLGLAEKMGFTIIRREDGPLPPHLGRDIDEVLDFYKEIMEHHKTE